MAHPTRSYSDDLTHRLSIGVTGWTLTDNSVAVFVDPEHVHPASYDLLTHEITVNTKTAGCDETTGLYTLALNGFLAHEAGHAEWSKEWRLQAVAGKERKRLNSAVWTTMTMLDEIRIERRSYDRGGKDTGYYLRHSFLAIVKEMIDAENMPTHALGLSHLWVLTCGRAIVGIADKATIEPVEFAVGLALGADAIGTMREILGEFVVTDDYEMMVRLAEEWVEEFGGSEESGGVGGTCGTSCDGKEATPGVGEKDESDEGEGEGTGKSDGDKEEADTDKPAGRTHGDGKSDGEDETVVPPSYDDDVDESDSTYDDDEPVEPPSKKALTPEEAEELLLPALEELAEEVETSLGDSTDMADPRKWGEKIFGTPPTTVRYTEYDVDPETQRKALMFTRDLEQVSTPSIVRTKVTALAPPGRMRGREMVRREAERSIGLMPSGEPWSAVRRRHTLTRPVVVGIATDVSGSMYWAEKLVAQFTYVVGYAGTRINARTAAVTFGSSVTATLKPGETPSKLRRVAAVDSTEQFDYAMAALDGVLNLRFQNRCTKLLFVFSDAELVKRGEIKRAQRWVKELQDGGTEIFWVAATHYSMIGLKGVHYINKDDSKASLYQILGEAVRGMVVPA